MNTKVLFFSLIAIFTACNGTVIPKEKFYSLSEQEADKAKKVSKNGRGPITTRYNAITEEYGKWFRERNHIVSQMPESTQRDMLENIKRYVDGVYRPVAKGDSHAF